MFICPDPVFFRSFLFLFLLPLQLLFAFCFDLKVKHPDSEDIRSGQAVNFTVEIVVIYVRVLRYPLLYSSGS